MKAKKIVKTIVIDLNLFANTYVDLFLEMMTAVAPHKPVDEI